MQRLRRNRGYSVEDGAPNLRAEASRHFSSTPVVAESPDLFSRASRALWSTLRRAVLSCCVVASLGGCAYLDLKQRQLIFQPTEEITGTPADFGFDFVELWLPVTKATPEGEPERLHGWWIASPLADAPAVLYLHGNGWNIGDSAYNTARLRRMGFSVLAIDYRGFGKSSGPFPSEAQVYEDAQIGWDHLKSRQSNPRRRFVYGHSLGAAVAIELAARNPDIAGLIVESGFTSIRELAGEVRGLGLLPLRWLVTQRFDSLVKIGAIKMPVLFLHGKADAVIPFTMSERLHAAAPQPKTLVLVPDAGHSSIAVVAWERYRQAVQEFVQRVGR